MTWVKICGMTNLEDALVAVEAGADAVGFVFYEKSPRCVTVETAREIVKQLPESVEKVGVFVDADCEQIRRTVVDTYITAVQLHGGHASESFYQDSRPAMKCFGTSRVIGFAGAESLTEGTGVLIHESVRQRLFAVIVDHQTNGVSGGTGKSFDWQASKEMVLGLGLMLPVVVAGGLTAENVGEAVDVLKPWGVDVVSGVEARPGKKDPEKVRAFVRAVREKDRKAS
jgi:phosphoribosylanthranilate isomerase